MEVDGRRVGGDGAEWKLKSPARFESQPQGSIGGDNVRGRAAKGFFIAIFGEVGVGKTTIIRSYLDQIDKQALKAIYILNPDVSFRGLLNAIYLQFI